MSRRLCLVYQIWSIWLSYDDHRMMFNMINKRLASATESRVGINQESPTAASQTPHCCFAIHSDVLSYIALSDIVLHCDMLSNTILDFKYICTLVVFCFLLYLHVCLSIYQHTSVHRVPIPYGATSIQYSLVCLSSWYLFLCIAFIWLYLLYAYCFF